MMNVLKRFLKTSCLPTQRFLLLLVLAGGLITCSMGYAQEPTPQEKRAVRGIKSNIDRAGKQYVAKKFELSKQYFDEAARELTELSAGARKELIEIIKPEFERLKVAHQLLTEAGLKLENLADLPEPASDDMNAVSFKKDVAPILVAKCGNCHVTRNRGDFSAATFAALENSTMVAFGLPDQSRMIEVIVSGEMPKGGQKIEPKELETLKTWIKQGAKFDGESPTQPLGEFVAAPPQPNRPRRLEPALPTGTETVSFGLDIAPILIENCGQCHINDNPRGNFNMGTFRNLLAGGDSGAVIEPGKSSASMLFKRIETGEMPPNGKLDSKSIDLIGKWIAEGAKFDGGDAQLETSMVAAVSKAKSQTHEELSAARRDLAARTWELVMAGVEPVTVSSDHFVVTGSTTESRLTDVSQLLEKLVPKVASALRSDSSEPIVKGNVSTFVFDKRYDFNEFGKMVERRDFPKDQTAHWKFTTIDAYAAVLMTRNETADSIKVALAKQLGALHVASLAPDVPRWFADGVGVWTAKKIYSREDEVKDWDLRAETAAAAMQRPDDFINDRMPADEAAMVSYLFVKNLKSDAGRFGKLMAEMRKGMTFASAFRETYGTTPEGLITGKN